MPDLDKIRNLLRDMNIQAVSRATGVSVSVLYKFVTGKITPNYEVVKSLVTYFNTRSLNG